MDAGRGADLVDRQLVDDLLAQHVRSSASRSTIASRSAVANSARYSALSWVGQQQIAGVGERLVERPLAGGLAGAGALALVADQLAGRGDPDPAAQRALAAVAGDAGRLAVPAD